MNCDGDPVLLILPKVFDLVGDSLLLILPDIFDLWCWSVLIILSEVFDLKRWSIYFLIYRDRGHRKCFRFRSQFDPEWYIFWTLLCKCHQSKHVLWLVLSWEFGFQNKWKNECPCLRKTSIACFEDWHRTNLQPLVHVHMNGNPSRLLKINQQDKLQRCKKAHYS